MDKQGLTALFKLTFIIGMPLVFSDAQNSHPSITEICGGSSFSASCTENKVLLITSAKYGRMQEGKCVKRNFGYLGCQADATGVMDSKCTGDRKCSIKGDSPDLKALVGCPRELVSYLEVGFQCVTVVKSSQSTCYSETTLVKDHIFVTSGDELYSQRCPLKFTVPPGQRMKVVLYKYTISFVSLVPNLCLSLGYTTEDDHEHALLLCEYPPKIRELSLYNSKTSQMNLSLGVNIPKRSFLMKIQAVGCIPLSSSAAILIIYKNTVAIARCIYSSEIVSLICVENKWIGELPRCLLLLTTEQIGVIEDESVWQTALTLGTLHVSIGALLLCFVGTLVIAMVCKLTHVAIKFKMKRRAPIERFEMFGMLPQRNPDKLPPCDSHYRQKYSNSLMLYNFEDT